VKKLAAYIPYFNPDFIGLTGNPAEIQRLTRNLGVAVSFSPIATTGQARENPEPQNYAVDHSSALFLVDPQGRLSGIFGAPHVMEQIIDDYLIITGQI